MNKWIYIGVVLGLVILTVLNLSIGGITIGFENWIDLFTDSSSTTGFHQQIVANIRLPRVLTALLVGGSLALSGLLSQRLFQNPLAEPSLLGISSGASLFAAIGLLFYATYFANFGINKSLLVIIFASIGAVLASYTVYKIGSTKLKTNTALLLLAGIAINLWLGSLLGFLLFSSNDEELRSITFWTMGSLSGATWNTVFYLALAFCISLALIFMNKKELDILLLGEEQAYSMGVSVESLKRRMMIIICLLTSTVVANCGIIGFVALIVPHISRILMGELIQKSWVLILILGSLFLLFADFLAKTILLPTDIPIGVITGILGAPYFLYLLFNTKKKIA